MKKKKIELNWKRLPARARARTHTHTHTHTHTQLKAQLVQNGPKGTEIDRVDQIGPKQT